MGSWFSNIHIRKSETIKLQSVTDYIKDMMEQQHYLPVASGEDADGAIAIVDESGCPWISVYSDLLSLENPKTFSEIAGPLSDALGTDILGISCFDSDYLYLNLVNTADKADAWIGIGSAVGLGVKRRSGLTAWKKKVEDFPAFSEGARRKYLFAEEFLNTAETCLGLPAVQGAASYEYLQDMGLREKAIFLYFKLSDESRTAELPRLVPHMASGMPCFLEKPLIVGGTNVGGASRGLSVYFLGPYVEHDEITFSDVCFVKWKNNQTQSVPFELTKIRLSDGQWAYYYHDPGFRIPPKVDPRLPMSKQLRATLDQSIIVRFVPHGNPRKILDVTVVLVPDKNHEGQTGWTVWHRWGSKEKFIAQFNESWDAHRKWAPDACPPVLRIEDFD